ncbi:hypothetical protein DPMN_117217 [Dreissena polymorpha]|uniref:Uncharacterized protein n=1 Tax=Dreissena polymorpha TaxID=45954 RepID=A0A9D4QU86_DREPO|nr:hypothetical protein DPMN_117217 [Dreissena polymorpha]
MHEVNADRTLSELHQPTGGDFGGTKVDNEFVNLLVKIFGAPLYQKFKRNHIEKYISLMQEFETKKRTFDGSRRMALQFPIELGEMYLEDVDQTFQSALHETPFEGKVQCIADKFIIVEELAKTFFDDTIEQIVITADNLLKKVPNMNSIILVGGFSESPYLKSVMRRRFGDMITIPLEPSQAVLNGAVVYGHRPLAIAERVCKYTYGIGRMMKFKPHHPAHRKVKIDGLDYCDGIFNKHIEVGTKIRVAEDAEKAVVHKYFPTTTAMKQAVLDVYASPFKDPMFVDDHGCQLVGLIKLDIDSHGDIYSELLVKMMFGGTELQVQVTDVKNNKITNASFGFLG